MATVSRSYTSADKLVQLIRVAANGRQGLLVSVLDTNRLGLGTDPLRPTHVIDLSTEKVGPHEPAEPSVSQATETPMPQLGDPGSKMARRSGNYWLDINGRRVECRSLKELLAEGLKELAEVRPDTLEKLSHIKLRSRRIVARDRRRLFDKERLTEKYSERLQGDWWYGTNNSASETNNWLQRACSCAGLKWGDEFKTSLGIDLSVLD